MNTTGVFTDATTNNVSVERVGGTATVQQAVSLKATTDTGNVYITEASGDLAIDQVGSSNGGNVVLKAQGDISVGKQNASTYYQGLVFGGSITLVSETGDIGEGAARPLQLNSGITPVGTTIALDHKVNASAPGSIALRETSLEIGDTREGVDLFESVVAAELLEHVGRSGDRRRLDAEYEAGATSDCRIEAPPVSGLRQPRSDPERCAGEVRWRFQKLARGGDGSGGRRLR